MGRLRRDGKRERGQILVLFELVLIVILGFAAMAIDLGVLRNNRQILVNTLDSAALAGGSVLPVDGSVAGKYAAELKLINDTIARDYPGLPASAYTISFRCLIGVNPTTQAVYLDEIPDQCNPIHALGHTPAAADFTRAGTVAHSACNPALLDKCNVVVIMGSAITDYKLAPVLGVANGSTGLVTSAACKGPCGNPQTVSPVDLVIILDRTGSMADNSNKVGPKIQALETAAKTVLSVYDPSKQRVALGLTGPGKVDASGVPTINSCSPGSGSAMGVADDQNFSPHATLTPSGTTSLFQGSFLSTTLTTAITTNGAISVKVASAAGFPTSGNYTIQIDSEQMLVTGGQGTTTWTVTNANRGLNATTKASHVVNSVVGWGVSKTDTTIKVNSAAGFPTTGSFTIKVDNEQMLVTSGAGTTTWTVTSANRGYNSTTAAVHGGNETVSLIYSTGATSIKVNSASGFPTSGSYTVVIDSEHMLVTSGQGTTTWTVTRGADSTTAATHIGGTTVTRVVGKTDTTIQVSAPYGPSASFPSVPFTIAVGLNGSNYEHMSVTAVAGSSAPFTWTVTRAQDSTPAATHNTGDDVDGVAPWVRLDDDTLAPALVQLFAQRAHENVISAAGSHVGDGFHRARRV
ncbi:MAG: TadE/TadG family type IV pilus assembly protein, partial [Candidatus Limnocylindrales bacterium]